MSLFALSNRHIYCKINSEPGIPACKLDCLKVTFLCLSQGETTKCTLPVDLWLRIFALAINRRKQFTAKKKN